MQDMLIPANAKVECVDGHAGSVATVVIDPVRKVLTHIVVNTRKDADHLVLLEHVDSTENDTVHLSCTVAELEAMPAFTETHYIKTEHYDYNMYPSGAYQSPYATGLPPSVEEEYVPINEEQIPLGELAIHRGAKIAAKDGNVGELEEFIVDPDSGAVSHFVLRKGHLWGKRDISIPVSAIDQFDGDSIHLGLSKHDVSQLPNIEVKRHYHG
jgi:hypothetical protein